MDSENEKYYTYIGETTHNLTHNKEYYIFKKTDNEFFLLDDDTFISFFDKEKFKSRSEIRQDKITSLID